MMFRETGLPGAVLIEPERQEDDRGFFARLWCLREFEAYGLSTTWVQGSVSFTQCKGTIRGLHFQVAPYAECKLVRCTRGAIYDVILDLRHGSPTFLRHIAVRLSADSGRLVYVPPGCAHGFQTLEDGCEVEYQMSEYYRPEAGRGVRWNDPAFGIHWPLPVTRISERDRTYPDFVAELLSSGHDDRGVADKA